MTTFSSPSHFVLSKLAISSPRFSSQNGTDTIDTDIDISEAFVELNLYESLTEPFITGDITIAVSTAIKDLSNLMGQETLKVSLYTNPNYIISKEFIIYSIRNETKAEGSSASILVLSLIEKHGYYSYFQRLDRSYEGKIEDIITRVYKENLFIGKDSIDGNYEDTSKSGKEGTFLRRQESLDASNFEKTNQAVKVTANNRTPLDFCMWLTSSATSDIGEPFFLYSTLKEGPQFRHLGSLLNKNNIVTPTDGGYFYSPIHNSSLNFEKDSFRILSIHFPEMDNTIKLAKAGALNKTFIAIDPFKKGKNSISTGTFDQNKYFEEKKLQPDRLIEKYNLFDKAFKIETGLNGTKSLNEVPSIIHSVIGTSGMYNYKHEAYNDSEDIADYLLSVRRDSDLNFLDKQRFTIITHGYNFLSGENNTSIGKVISLFIPNSRIFSKNTSSDQFSDPKISANGKGYYLITRIRHKFGINYDYTTSLEISKISNSINLNENEESN